MAVKDFVKLHDAITKLYYIDKAITKDQFNKAHTLCSLYLEQKLITAGVKDDYYIDNGFDYKNQIPIKGTILRSAEIGTILSTISLTQVKTFLQSKGLMSPDLLGV